MDHMGLYTRALFRESRIDLFLAQIYSFTRVATLMAVILNLIGLNVTKPINCQVGAMSWGRLVTHET